MFGNVELSVEALVAMSMGDEDWQELAASSDEGCYRKPSLEVERSHHEAEPNVDKFTSDTTHFARYA